MFKLTIVVGVFALVALALPDLVLLGLFLIVPGMVLMVAPTAFIYLAVSTAIRSCLPARMGVSAVVLSFAGAVVLGSLIAIPFRVIDEREYRAAILEDVVAGTPITISGHVRVERPDITHPKRAQEETCDSLCAALLCIPEVESVTVAKGKNLDSVKNWRLVPQGSVADTGLAPKDPGDILRHYPVERNLGLSGTEMFKFQKARRKSLAAEWNLRLANQQTLVASDLSPNPDTTIVITNLRDRSQPRVERVEIFDNHGQALLRRSLVKHAAVQIPFRLSFYASFGGSRFAAGRKRLSTGARYERMDPITVLVENVSGLHQIPSDDAPLRVKRELVAALDTPKGRPGGLALGPAWLNELDKHALSEEDALIARRIVGDLRIRNVGDSLKSLFPHQAPIAYRPLLVQRIVAPETNASDRSYFAELLSNMPHGTFADMTPDEWRMIHDPKLRMDTVPFVERLADLKQAGVAPLRSILQSATTTIPQWCDRKATVHAVRRGFARIGEAGADALPMVRALFEQRPSPITNSARDALEWRVAMARMGLAIDDLPHPPSWNESQISRMREKVERALARFDSNGEIR